MAKDYIPEAYIARAQFGWVVSVISLVLEIILLVLIFWLMPPEGKESTPEFLIITIPPLVMFLPFLLKRSIHAHVWLCFLSLFYFAAAVGSGLDLRYGFIGRLELVNTIVLFVITMCFARWEQRRLGITITPKT